MGVSNGENAAAPWAKPGVFRQFNAVRLVFKGLVDEYHAQIMPEGFLKRDFDVAAQAAVQKMSPRQKQVLKKCANPKALGLWDYIGADDGSTDKVSSFLKNCFSDSCGHLLIFSSFKIQSEDDVKFNLKKIMCLGVGLKNVAKNFEIILAEDIRAFPQLRDYLEILKKASGEIDKAAKRIALEMEIDPEAYKAMKDREIACRLNNTTSIAYIKPIRARSWHAEPT